VRYGTRLTGLPADQELSLADNFSMPIISPSADSLLEVALRQRLEMCLAQDAVKTAALEHKLVSLSRRPTLHVGVQMDFQNEYFPALDAVRGNFVAGASVSVPIFTGFRIENQKQMALTEMNAAQAHSRDIERQITAEARQAYLGAQYEYVISRFALDRATGEAVWEQLDE
jgi:outer membrane protein TolC